MIGDVAGALHGWPLVLNSSRLELCVPAGSASPERDAGDTAPPAALVAIPAGTAGFSDLARDAESIPLAGGDIRVASLLDLLRIADASPDPAARRQALAYQAVLDVQHARRAAPTTPAPSDVAKIQDWLSHQTPVTAK